MELPTAGDVGPGELVKHMNPKELHKRTITVYAYEALRPYKSYFASLLEWSAIFWSIRIYYEVRDPSVKPCKHIVDDPSS
jgi:hypothetical protein